MADTNIFAVWGKGRKLWLYRAEVFQFGEVFATQAEGWIADAELLARVGNIALTSSIDCLS
jgi:hypothetical protein